MEKNVDGIIRTLNNVCFILDREIKENEVNEEHLSPKKIERKLKIIKNSVSSSRPLSMYKKLSKEFSIVKKRRSLKESYKEKKRKLDLQLKELGKEEFRYRNVFRKAILIQEDMKRIEKQTKEIMIKSTTRRYPSQYYMDIDIVFDRIEKKLGEISQREPTRYLREEEKIPIPKRDSVKKKMRRGKPKKRPRPLSQVSNTPSIPSPIVSNLPEINFKPYFDVLDLSKSCLGIGRYGRVYRISLEDNDPNKNIIRSTDESFSIKLVHETSEKSLKREIELVQALSGHKNIMNILSWCPKNLSGEKYMGYMMPYYEKGSVMRIIRQSKKKMKWKTILNIVYQTAKGMDYVHRNNIIHYDLKWSNVLLSSDGIAKICDFGLSKRVSRKDFLSFVRGASHYISPEVYYLEKITNKCDVYAFGMMLFEILVGTFDPFNVKSDSAMKTVLRMASLNKKYRPILSNFPNFEYRKEVHGKYVEIMKDCWKHDYNKRPSFREVVLFFEAYYPKITKEVEFKVYGWN